MSQRKVLAGIVLVIVLAAGGAAAGGLLFTDVFAGDEPTESAGQDEPADTESTDSDSDSDDGSETDSGAGDSSAENESTESTDGVETASMPVSIEAADRGPVEEGEMRLYNTTSGGLTATHNFSDGHEHTFENLTRETTYELVVNVSYFPDETFTFNPRISDEIDETIGYEFRGADSYVIEWEVDVLPNNVDYDDEDAEELARTHYGTSKLGKNGDFYTSWNARGYGDTYDHLWIEEVQQAYLDYPSRGTDWQKSNRNYSVRTLTRDIIAEDGLSDIYERKFIGEKNVISLDRDVVHVYQAEDVEKLDPINVHVDPHTGYVVYVNYLVDKMDDPEATRSTAEYHSHNEPINPIPDNFPLSDKIET